MPTYQYACTECGHRFEAVQAFTDDSLTTCPVCSGQLRKVYGSVGVVFKGSGFYRTDSRNGKTTSTAAAGESKSEGKTETKSETKSETKPAAKSESSGGSSSSSSASTPAKAAS
ncbi:FmdB family zinc ribbon protein [Nakamurella sp.]|uniref:FmdB family zinc ribbon protein n=1 Tax=Nakamurella sp. TaxID=1869182 RepID=UPI003B3B3F13